MSVVQYANLGDYFQTFAIDNIYKELQIKEEDIVTINRSELYKYEGEELTLPMQGWFGYIKGIEIFPLPEKDGMLSEDALPQILEKLPKMDALLIGPGLGQSPGTFRVLTALLENARCPAVVDADGINLLAGHMDVLHGRAWPTVLTPHDGEFARLFGPVGEDRMAAAQRAARESGAIVLLKGHRTCITDGITAYRNTTGNPGMAVGGSGDVLAGILVGLLGQGLAPLEAAACAAWLHGSAGDACAERLGQYAMLPTDLLEALPQFLK